MFYYIKCTFIVVRYKRISGIYRSYICRLYCNMAITFYSCALKYRIMSSNSDKEHTAAAQLLAPFAIK